MIDRLHRLLVFLSRWARGLCLSCGQKMKYHHDVRRGDGRLIGLVYQCNCGSRKFEKI